MIYVRIYLTQTLYKSEKNGKINAERNIIRNEDLRNRTQVCVIIET